MQRIKVQLAYILQCSQQATKPAAWIKSATCILLGDAGELFVQEALQIGGACAGSQPLDKLQVHRGWVMLHLLKGAGNVTSAAQSQTPNKADGATTFLGLMPSSTTP